MAPPRPPASVQSDAFVVILVAAFSIMNGYFTVLIYEYAAAGRHKSDQTAATRLLNICFQVGIRACEKEENKASLNVYAQKGSDPALPNPLITPVPCVMVVCFGCVYVLQVAAFVAVVLSVTVTSLGWLDHVIPTVDDVYYDDQAAPASR